MNQLKILLQSKYFLIISLLFVILLSFIRMQFVTINEKDFNEFTGIVTSKKIDGNKLTMIIKGKYKVRVDYYIKDEKELEFLDNLDLGIKIQIKGSKQELTNNTIPNTFNYKKYLKNSLIDYVILADKYKIINKKTNILYKLKNSFINYIKQFKSKNYLSTFMIGSKDYLADGVYEQYQSLGVSHIFAISGMHISMLTLILFKLLSKIKERKRYIIVISFLIVYMFITDYQASVLRSTILFIMLYLNKRFDFNMTTFQCLYLTIILILLRLPNMIYNIGFLYSSIISFSLIKYSHLIKGNYIMKCLKISLIAFLFSLPITINNNFEVNILSIINNLFFVPLISFIIYPLSLLTIIIKPLDNILYTITNILENVSLYLPVCNIVVPKLNIVIIILYYILLFLFFSSYRKIYLISLVLLILLIKLLVILDDNLYVYYLDVKQGDSTVIKYRDKAIMIDTGGITSFKQEEWKKRKKNYLTDNSITFLKSIGINHLDYLILTHGDFDHMGEAEHLINNYKVRKVIFNNNEYNNLEKSLIKVLNDKKIKYYKGLEKIEVNNMRLEFLNTGIYNDENNASNVIYFKHNRFKLLFMGDAGEEREEDIINQYNVGSIDFLKVGHHGSDTSSSQKFIETITPKYSIIFVGENNRYGHPNDSVLNTLGNSKIYRTDLDGTIEIKLNKTKYSINTYSP